MKIKNLLLFAAAAMSVSAFAQQTGELCLQGDGVTPQMSGQATQDHFFVRGNYNETTFDNVINIPAGQTQVVWFHLDNAEILANPTVQALTPIAYNSNGDLYKEVTYNSFQFDLYVPEGFSIVAGEDEEGEEIMFEQGDLMPKATNIKWGKKETTKVVDDITYNVYTVVAFNMEEYGSHLSGKTAKKYQEFSEAVAAGTASWKDYSVFGLYMKNDNVDNHTNDMIVANQILNFREANVAEWDANQSTFNYATGGNNETQLFMLYNRARVYGTNSVVENLGEKTINNVKYYNVAGMESNVPFDGVNIKVVTYTDGTTSTSKVMK
jgi:hypothetical protein